MTRRKRTVKDAENAFWGLDDIAMEPELGAWEWKTIIEALKHCARPSHRNVGHIGTMDWRSERLEVELEHAEKRVHAEFLRQNK
jgi:hypothetical protein